MSGPGDPPADDSPFYAWAAGGAALAGCADLLVAVVAGIPDAEGGGVSPLLPVALPLAGVSLASFAAAALALRATPRAFLASGIFHVAVAAGLFAWVQGNLRGMPIPALAVIALHALFGVLAFAAVAAVRREPADLLGRKFASAAGAVAENLESVLVAIVFALAIRHFAVEAYKIPTASMEPTLLGNNARRGTGDRVLVQKWRTLLGGPERWEIWVFRPPLERAINYVKRVVGLPGEEIEIRDGDLYVDGKIARKPERTREDMWFPVWPRADGRAAKGAEPWRGDGFRGEGEDAFSIAAAPGERLLRYFPGVRDGPVGDGSYPVGDVRLRFAVEAPAAGTQILARITGRGGPCEARVAADGSSVATTCGGKTKADHEAPRAAVREVEVSFADLLFEVRVNGEVAASVEVEPAEAGKRAAYGVEFGVAAGGGATFRGIRLDRDVFYTDTGTSRFRVPQGQYLFFGDNSSNSQDARAWKAWEIAETAPGGRTFYSKESPSRRDVVEFTDRNGVRRSYAAADVEITPGLVPLSFVPAADLHGRAFAVFWPPRWFTTMAGGRVRFLP